jgi:hypothetical protein
LPHIRQGFLLKRLRTIFSIPRRNPGFAWQNPETGIGTLEGEISHGQREAVMLNASGAKTRLMRP